MTAPPLTGRAFRDRFAIQCLDDGGVLVDLVTGTYLRLNASAAAICEILSEVDDERSGRQRVGEYLGGPDDLAARAIEDVMRGLGGLGPRREPLGAFRYRPLEQGGYVLASAGSPRILIDSRGVSLRLAPAAAESSRGQLVDYLRAVAPKLLFLQSMVVIHASASRTASGVRLISGESGAGKTTTARAFAAAGVPLFAEDMLVVASTSPFAVHGNGEEVINRWAVQSAERLGQSPLAAIDASVLREATAGRSIPVSEVWFIDEKRRVPETAQFTRKRMGPTDGVLSLMRSLFLGGASADEWRHFLSLAGQIARSVPVYEAIVPAGLDGLGAAVRAYTENSAS
jgi:hypothetical protein